MIEKLIKELSKFQAIDSSCKKVYCTTCGGLAYAVKRNMTAKLWGDINIVLSEISVSDFMSLGEWGDFFQDITPISVKSVFEREGERINTSDIRELDRYLLDARKLMINTSTYKKMLEQGVKTAIETSDESLLETLSIVLGENILNNTQLFSLALIKSKSLNSSHKCNFKY